MNNYRQPNSHFYCKYKDVDVEQELFGYIVTREERELEKRLEILRAKIIKAEARKAYNDTGVLT